MDKSHYHGQVFYDLVKKHGKITIQSGHQYNPESAYIINEQIGIVIKYITDLKEKVNVSFSLSSKDHSSLIELGNKFPDRTYLICVAEGEIKFSLSISQLATICELGNKSKGSIYAEKVPNKGYFIKGSIGELKKNYLQSEYLSFV